MRFLLITMVHILILSLCTGVYLLLVKHRRAHRYHTIYYYIGIVLTVFWLVPAGLLADLFVYLPLGFPSFDDSIFTNSEQKPNEVIIDPVQMPELNLPSKEPLEIQYPEMSFHQGQENEQHLGQTFFDTQEQVTDRTTGSERSLSGIIFVILMAVWGTGAMCSLSLSVIHEVRTRKRLMRHSEKIMTESRIPCYSCEIIQIPMLVGLFHVVLLLPKTEAAVDRLPSILAHESVHYQRHDSYMKLLNLLVTSIYWWNPIVYFMAKAVEAECEFSCDERAVGCMNNDEKKQYGETILFFAGQQPAGRKGGYFAMHLLTDKEQITERIRIVSQKSRASAKSIVVLVLFSCMAFVLWGCGMKQTAVMTESETDTSASEEFSSSHSNGTNDESTVETGSENETGLQETPETENETETGIPETETETETEAPQILSREEVILLAKKNLKAQYERFREEQTGEISSTTGIVCLELRVPDIGRYTPGDLVKSFDYYDENMNRILKDTHMNHIFGETDYFTACYISEEEVSLIGYKDTTRADFDSDDNIVMFQIGRDSYVGPGNLTLDFVDYDHDGADELVIKESYSGGDGFYTFMSAWEINREQYLPERSQEFDRLHVDVTEEEDAFVITENDSGFSKRFLKNELDKHGFDIFTIGPGEGFLNGGFCATAKLQETPADGTVEIEMSMPMYGIAPTIEIRYSLYFQDGKWQIRILDCEAI